MTVSAGIPKHIHQIWLGDPEKMPLELVATWKIPGWGYTLWREKEIDALKLESRATYDFYYKRKMWPGASNVARVEILRRVGGIYVDSDAERLLPLDKAPFICEADFFAAEANSSVGVPKGVARIANSILGSIANHPILVAYAEALRHAKDLVPSWNTTGGTLLTKMVGLHRTGCTVILPPHTFYPHDSNNRPSRTRAGDGGLPTYARHFWGSTHKLYSTSWHTQDAKKPQADKQAPPVVSSTHKAAKDSPRDTAVSTSSTKAIVICAGEATRWKNHRGVPKHLVEIEGERILDRTVRLLRERGIQDVCTAVKETSAAYEVKGATQVSVILDYKNNADADKFLSSKALWSKTGRTLVVYGDCYFTDDAMNLIVNFSKREWTLFCRPQPSKITGGKYGECFVQSFYPEHLSAHETALHRIADLWKRKVIDRCGGWEHYWAMVGLPDDKIRRAHAMSTNFVEINDWTDDFDYPDDYETWLKKRQAFKQAS